MAVATELGHFNDLNVYEALAAVESMTPSEVGQLYIDTAETIDSVPTGQQVPEVAVMASKAIQFAGALNADPLLERERLVHVDAHATD